MNILWLVCSVPVITAGASTTALYSVMFKIIKKEEGYIIKSFLKAFRQNFKQSTIIWLLLIGTGCIVGYDWYIAVTYIKLNRQIINILVVGIIIFLLWGWIFVFPLIACFENTIKNMIKNAFLIPISQLPYAVNIILFDIVCIGGTLYNYRTLFYGSIFWSSIGGSLLVYVNSIFMSKIFEPYR
ncbi:MAG: YesL family protein [Coprococcus sp.]|nr:YesL family protein [Coprococcus sp.]